MSHAARRDDLLFYAAGALEGDERLDVEAHLRSGCPRCEADLSAAESIVVDLALLPAPVEPAPEVRVRLVERVGRSARARAPVRFRARSAPVSIRRVLAAGLAALAAAGLGAAALERLVAVPLRERAQAHAHRARALAQDLAEVRAERDELRRQLVDQDDELAAFEEAADASDELVRFLRSPGLQSVALAPTPSQPGATARVFWEWDDYGCHLHASGLRPPAPERVYALWLHTEDGGAIRVGTFVPGRDGEASLFARLPRDVARVVRTSVTEEARDPGDAPSGPVQLAAAVADPRR
jgi:anti-sigma factor RsiW